MRLISLARFRYGLHWPGIFPRIDWKLWIQALVFVAFMLCAYALVEAISKTTALSDRAAVTERQKLQYEQALAHYMNGGSLRTEAGGMIMCEKALWVAL